ncbi:hypothetical protein LJC35_03585 [Parabacteroides sp. OttesenSCG-928-N08]|nr:hypothetical protein [Parabacteroides sp. OttesenSCG-928-N08]
MHEVTDGIFKLGGLEDNMGWMMGWSDNVETRFIASCGVACRVSMWAKEKHSFDISVDVDVSPR